jgi:hypothetical protein
MIQEASQHGQVIVIVNSDEWLMRKKGYIFMPFAESAVRSYVDLKPFLRLLTWMIPTAPSVRRSARLKPTYFANGGDRKTDNTPEMDVCDTEGIQLLWNGIGGGKSKVHPTLVADSGMTPEVQTDGGRSDVFGTH